MPGDGSMEEPTDPAAFVTEEGGRGKGRGHLSGSCVTGIFQEPGVITGFSWGREDMEGDPRFRKTRRPPFHRQAAQVGPVGCPVWRVCTKVRPGGFVSGLVGRIVVGD